MQHPAKYSTIPLGACHIMVVDAGTVIKDDRSGEEVTIDNETAASKGPLVYCTKAVYDALKAKVDAQSKPASPSPAT